MVGGSEPVPVDRSIDAFPPTACITCTPIEVTLEDWADDDFFSTPVTGGGARSVEEEEEEEERERARSIALLKRMEAPLTLWTIPEVSSSGISVEEALAQGERVATPEDLGGTIVYGYGYFKDLARGRLSGDLNGFLKIIARAESPSRHVIVGVHVVGDGANELIQLGSVLVHSRTTLEELSNTPFAGTLPLAWLGLPRLGLRERFV